MPYQAQSRMIATTIYANYETLILNCSRSRSNPPHIFVWVKDHSRPDYYSSSIPHQRARDFWKEPVVTYHEAYFSKLWIIENLVFIPWTHRFECKPWMRLSVLESDF